jgi:hypothetical protein
MSSLGRKIAVPIPEFRLFVWRDILRDWGDGCALAYARTEKEAVEALKNAYHHGKDCDSPPGECEFCSRLISSPDNTIDNTYTLLIYGSQ